MRSSRGANGGYVLEKPASEIKLSNIIYAVNEEVKTLNCKKNSKRGCNHKSVLFFLIIIIINYETKKFRNFHSWTRWKT